MVEPRWLTPVADEDIARGDGDFICRFAEAFAKITKDSVAGLTGEPMVLRQWQKDLLGRLFARDEDGGLRNRISLVGMPRKSGKSALGSLIAAFALVDVKTKGAEIYSVAADRNQARIVFEDTKKMIQNSELSEHVKVYRDSLYVPATGNVYRVLSADANYSWSDLREECRSNSTRPLIKHREQTPLQKAHNARMNEDYNQRWMSETGFSQLKEDDGEKLRSRSWHGQFRELTRKCIVHNLTQAAS